MLIKYVGPCAAGVTIAATRQHAPQGEPVEVPDEVAAGLLDQSVWESAKTVRTKEK